MTRIRLLILSSLCLALAVPSVASAGPAKQSFPRTYPVANVLCKHADNGKLPKKLAASRDQIKAACATLHASFDSAQATFRTTIAPLRQQANAAIATAKTTCETARAEGHPADCKAARQQARATLRSLHAQAKTAVKTWRTAIRAARHTFWSTISDLRGGSSLKQDKGAVPTPSTGVPTTV